MAFHFLKTATTQGEEDCDRRTGYICFDFSTMTRALQIPNLQAADHQDLIPNRPTAVWFFICRHTVPSSPEPANLSRAFMSSGQQQQTIHVHLVGGVAAVLTTGFQVVPDPSNDGVSVAPVRYHRVS